MKQRFTQKSNQDAELEQKASHQQEQQQGAAEFASVEEAIRADAAQTVVPEGLGERILRDLDAQQKARPWWKRWFSS